MSKREVALSSRDESDVTLNSLSQKWRQITVWRKREWNEGSSSEPNKLAFDENGVLYVTFLRIAFRIRSILECQKSGQLKKNCDPVP